MANGGTFQTERVEYVNRTVVISGTGTDSTQVIFMQRGIAALTQTGILNKYDTLSLPNITTQIGLLLHFCVDIGTPEDATSGTFTCTIETNASTGTGGTPLLTDVDFGVRGTICADVGDTTEVLIGPDERIKCASNTSTGNALVGKGVMFFREAEL